MSHDVRPEAGTVPTLPAAIALMRDDRAYPRSVAFALLHLLVGSDAAERPA